MGQAGDTTEVQIPTATIDAGERLVAAWDREGGKTYRELVVDILRLFVVERDCETSEQS